MAVYHVNGPNGEVYEVTAPDNASQADVVAFAQQHAQSAPAPKSADILDQIGSGVSAAAGKLGADAKTYYASHSDPRKPASTGGSMRAEAGLAGDVLGIVGAVAGPVLDRYVVQPSANALDKIPLQGYAPPKPTIQGGRLAMVPAHPMTPEETHADNEKVVGNALAAIPAGRVAAPVAVASTGNRLAETVAAFDRAGVNPMLAANGGKGTVATTNAIAENPIAGALVRGRLKTSIGQVGDRANALAGQFGETRGPQITGENVRAGVQDFARNKDNPTSFAAKAEDLYNKAFTPIETAEGQAVERAQNDFSARNAHADATHAANVDAHAAATEQAQRAANSSNALTSHLGQETTPSPIPPPVRPDVSPQRPVVTPTATITTLQQLAGRVNAPTLSNLITDSRVRSIMEALSTDAPDVRFNDLRQLRTWVRNAQGNQELRQGITSAGLQQLERSLTTDIYDNAARLGGPKALQALQRADDYYRAGSARIQTALQPFADAKGGESAYSRVVQAAGSTASADAQKLLSLKRSLAPSEWGDVASNVLSELGKPTAGAAAPGEPGFSISTFVTNYNKLSPRGKDILFSSIGGGGRNATNLRAELDNLARVADTLKTVEKGANTSKTFVNGQAWATLGLLLNHVTALPTAAGLAGAGAVGEVLTNPKVVRWISRLGQASASPNPTQLRVVVRQLQIAAQSNAALLPLSKQAPLLLEAPKVATPAAATQDPQSGQ